MSGIKNQNGFTLLEILVAVFIMSLGFLAAAQMQALSLRQKQLAEQGTVATNVVQYASDRDMAEVRRLHLLNSTAYVDAQAERIPNLSYCDNGPPDDPCGGCPGQPCDPLEALTPNPADGVNEATCAAVDVNNFDPTKLIFRTTGAQCDADADAIRAANSSVLYLVKQATTNLPPIVNGIQTLTVSITYAVKTQSQVEEELSEGGDGFSVDLNDSLASQNYEVTAHQDDWSDFIPGWNVVNIPHIP